MNINRREVTTHGVLGIFASFGRQTKARCPKQACCSFIPLDQEKLATENPAEVYSSLFPFLLKRGVRASCAFIHGVLYNF